jgi:hypothetical protein
MKVYRKPPGFSSSLSTSPKHESEAEQIKTEENEIETARAA